MMSGVGAPPRYKSVFVFGDLEEQTSARPWGSTEGVEYHEKRCRGNHARSCSPIDT